MILGRRDRHLYSDPGRGGGTFGDPRREGYIW